MIYRSLPVVPGAIQGLACFCTRDPRAQSAACQSTCRAYGCARARDPPH
jgi:hypothetical protein